MKKTMKKLLPLFLAVVMSLAFAGAALADDAPTSGSITVNPNNNGQTYTLYKLFDAHIAFSAKPDTDPVEYQQQAITYTLPSGKTLDATGLQWFTVDPTSGNVEKTSALTEDVLKSAEFKTWAKTFGTTVGEPITATQDDDANVKWSNLGFGYYFVDSTLGSFIGIDSNQPDATIQDKNNPPKLDKKIKSVKDSADANSGNIFDATDTAEIQFEGDGSNEHAIAQIGDTITYTIEVTAKPGAENYVVTDTLDAGLTPPAAATGVTVKAGDTDLTAQETTTGTKDATVSISGQVITVNFSNDYLNTIAGDTVITIEYSATLNSSALVATNSNDNTAKLEWGHKTDKDSTEDQSKVWTAEVSVNKKIDNANGEPLPGAGFKLKNSANKYYKLDNGVVTWVDKADADEFITGANGELGSKFTGLANGEYTLEETTVPDGYSKMTDTSVTIQNNDVTETNLSQTKTVINKKGTALPSTGGIGTTIFYIAGSALVLVAGAALFARRVARKQS